MQLDAPLTATASWLDRPAIVDPVRTWTWRDIHMNAAVLAGRLDEADTLCNLCNSRVGFLVTWLAAARRNCLQLLPPSGGHADLVAMLSANRNPCVVVDDVRGLPLGVEQHARCLVYAPQPGPSGATDTALAWQPAWNAPRICLYTSGSTGKPEPQLKTVGQLARGAVALGQRLAQEIDDWPASLGQIVCSVPPQHMFGIESSVMLSLVYGVPVLDRRPLLPADVRAAFDSCAGGALWTATPLHLRALQRAGETVPNCRAVIASTMPLAAELAAQVEVLVSAPVLEIYGSTETGAIALRRTARAQRWRPLPDVRLEPAAEGTCVWGSHFASPQTLADRIETDGEGGFSLLGRQADLIKIAGRRASLSGLNQLLLDLPGLADGVFYLPDTGAPGERLVLIYAGATLNRAAIEDWLRVRVDAAFLPRGFIRVDCLPRSHAGKLPRTALDQIYAAWLAQRKA